jgi:hypothetical protein
MNNHLADCLTYRKYNCKIYSAEYKIPLAVGSSY